MAASMRPAHKVDSSSNLSAPLLFGIFTLLLNHLIEWPKRWLISGAPLLTFLLLLGSSRSCRVLPSMSLWTIIATLNLAYALAATSWLLYWMFLAGCYPLIFLTSLFQFKNLAYLTRQFLRLVLKKLHFVNDEIAFFDIPALEIDTDVDGLMVIRGITFSLSTLTIVARGIEVGIKLSEDLELAIQTEKVTIRLFRGIDIGDCYANLKGGDYEMTFGNIEEEDICDEDGDALMVEATPLLRAAAAHSDTTSPERPRLVKMSSRLTDGQTLKHISAKEGFNAMTQFSPDDTNAETLYYSTIKWIEETNYIHQAREKVNRVVDSMNAEENNFDLTSRADIRAAVCSQLHDKPSVPHPPPKSIKVTTLQQLSPPWLRTYLHRLPLLIRLLLNPISHFHPVKVASITAAGSGKWITYTLQEKLFKHYGEESAEVRRLEEKITSWLSGANFAFEMAGITGISQVPILTAFDIVSSISIRDLMAYRTLPAELNLKQVLRMGGADATFTIPSFLLPHHEHLLPAVSTFENKEHLAEDVEKVEGKPQALQHEHALKQAEKDEANVKVSVHARLPVCFDQDLLDFVAALVKASKVVEMEKEPSPMDQEVNSLKDFSSSLGKSMKVGMKKAAVDGIINDKWIAKMIGKITKKLEATRGDVGYSGDIPVALEVYRLPEGHPEAAKILP